MLIIRSIYFYIYFFISLAFLSRRFTKHKAKKPHMAKDDYETIVNNEARWWANKIIKNSGAKINVIGQENIPDEAVLFVANHQSGFDIAIFLGCIEKNKGYISKPSIFKIPFIKNWMDELRCVSISQTDVRQGAKAILEGIAVLKDGYSMVIFPEGTRSLDGTMRDFKAGSFKLATKSKVPIVPVTIDGAINVLGKKDVLVKPSEVNVTIHPPVYTKDLDREGEVALPGIVKAAIESGFAK